MRGETIPRDAGHMTRLVCYALHAHAPRIVPAPANRPWMDEFPGGQAYRCLPMTIANAYGWHVLCLVPIEIEWNGGRAVDDLTVRALKPLLGGAPVHYFCRSHFSCGIVTMHVDYVFRTDPGWNLLATGPFNSPKENAYPLTGLVDTDSLPYPFTMNWRLFRPGRLRFEEGEPFCLLFPLRMESVVECTPEIRRLADAPELHRQYKSFRAARQAAATEKGQLQPATERGFRASEDAGSGGRR